MCLLSGDVRRPYPTEMDMRSSLLAKFSDLPGGSQTLTAAAAAAAAGGGYTEIPRHPTLLGIVLITAMLTCVGMSKLL